MSGHQPQTAAIPMNAWIHALTQVRKAGGARGHEAMQLGGKQLSAVQSAQHAFDAALKGVKSDAARSQLAVQLVAAGLRQGHTQALACCAHHDLGPAATLAALTRGEDSDIAFDVAQSCLSQHWDVLSACVQQWLANRTPGQSGIILLLHVFCLACTRSCMSTDTSLAVVECMQAAVCSNSGSPALQHAAASEWQQRLQPAMLQCWLASDDHACRAAVLQLALRMLASGVPFWSGPADAALATLADEITLGSEPAQLRARTLVGGAAASTAACGLSAAGALPVVQLLLGSAALVGSTDDAAVLVRGVCSGLAESSGRVGCGTVSPADVGSRSLGAQDSGGRKHCDGSARADALALIKAVLWQVSAVHGVGGAVACLHEILLACQESEVRQCITQPVKLCA